MFYHGILNLLDTNTMTSTITQITSRLNSGSNIQSCDIIGEQGQYSKHPKTPIFKLVWPHRLDTGITTISAELQNQES